MIRRVLPIWTMLFIFAVFPVPAQTGTAGAGVSPLNAMENYRAGRNLESMNRMSEAETYYREAVRLSTEEIARNAATADSYTALTWALQRQKRYADVITWGQRGLAAFADEQRIVEIMGEAYFYQDDYDSSLRFMQRYVNSRPQGERASTAYFFIGEIFRLNERFRHADIAYTTAVRLEPAVALWWYRLGSVREAVGDLAPAVEAYESALRINPNYREAASGLARSRR
jgi:tetratricopeptide (TPR) repeat protein